MVGVLEQQSRRPFRKRSFSHRNSVRRRPVRGLQAAAACCDSDPVNGCRVNGTRSIIRGFVPMRQPGDQGTTLSGRARWRSRCPGQGHSGRPSCCAPSLTAVSAFPEPLTSPTLQERCDLGIQGWIGNTCARAEHPFSHMTVTAGTRPPRTANGAVGSAHTCGTVEERAGWAIIQFRWRCAGAFRQDASPPSLACGRQGATWEPPGSP